MRFHIHTIYEEGDMKPIITSNVWMMTLKRKWDNALSDLVHTRALELLIEGIERVEGKMSTRSPWETEPDFLYFEYIREGKKTREMWVRIR